MLLVTHDAKVASIAGRRLVLDRGKLLESTIGAER